MKKIAVTAQGSALDSQGDPRFGRAAGFVVHELGTEAYAYVPNDQNMNLAQGAGIQAAQTVAGLGVSAVITGRVGPKAFSALGKGGVEIYLAAPGTVGEWIEAYKQDRLTLASESDKGGGW